MQNRSHPCLPVLRRFAFAFAFLLILLPATALAMPIYIGGTYSSSTPRAVASNPVTGQVYLARTGAFPTGDVLVIDDRTGDLAAIVGLPYMPEALAVDDVAGKTYVVPWAPVDKMYIIDSATNAVSEVVSSSKEFYRKDVAVNPATHKVYLAGYMWLGAVANPYQTYLSAFDARTHSYTVPTMVLGAGNSWEPRIAVMTATNKIYVTAQDAVKVVNGATDAVIATVAVGAYPKDLVVDTTRNRVYVVNRDGNDVSVIDGASDVVVTTVPVGKAPVAIAIDYLTNEAYVANSGDGTVSVIDLDTNTVSAALAVGDAPSLLAIDENLHRVYIGTGARLKTFEGATQVLYEPNLIYQPTGTFYGMQDLYVTPSHKVYITERHNYDDYGWWYTLADIDLVASAVEAGPPFLTASSQWAVSLTVTLKDSLGDAVPGAAVAITATEGPNTIIGSGAKTGLDGRVTAQLWSTRPGQKVVTATLPEGKSLANTATVTFTAPRFYLPLVQRGGLEMGRMASAR